ncbi:MAG: ABC transporter ATP-binding protein/permease [Erysipelotrichaceae bacterium]|nr:ABC transporter ATP-binding protein/permease [Erysipelotrichaceae bacterium]
MIQLKNVNKYYNRRKKNQIHVINNTNLELEKTGLIAILGESGCGKTTLLNAIGGLDKVSSGSIYVNGKKMNSIFSYQTDKIRNLNIGYIFQDYHLIDTMTVFDNVALALKMVGIKNKDEIKKRVNYVLEAVNMYRYRNRLASNLSGGERQRVGIARALVKNPPIIIADEPTGNLDSKNTIEIMNIIKGISQSKLVILVTHEKNLAYFYASRIIELSDGKVVNDYSNDHENTLDYRIDNKMYLKDFANQMTIDQDMVKLHYYQDEQTPLDIDIVLQNGNLYIKTNGFKKVEVVDDHSAIEFIDDHYKMISKDDYQKDMFDMHGVENKQKLRYASIVNPLVSLVDGFRRVNAYSVIKKILLVGFCFAAMAMLFATSRVFGSLAYTDDEFTTTNNHHVLIRKNTVSLDDYDLFSQLDGVSYILPSDASIDLTIPIDFYYQTNQQTVALSGALTDVNTLTEEDLVYGRLPENSKEIVVDRLAIEKMFRQYTFIKNVGIYTAEDMVGLYATVNKIGEMQIVGMVDKMDPSIYADASMFTNLLIYAQDAGNYYYEDKIANPIEIGCTDYQLYVDNGSISLKKGRYPTNDYEVILNYNQKDTYKIGKYIPYKVNGKKLKVVGYYTTTKGIDEYLVSSQTVLYELVTKTADVTVYTDDKPLVINQLHELGVNVEDPYNIAKQTFLQQRREGVSSTIVISGIMIVISLVEIFLMLRASFLSRVKEVGVYRAIGVKKLDIYQMFLGEILAITLLSGTVGFLFMGYVLSVLRTIPYIGSDYVLSVPVFVLSISLYFIFNILVGLYPLFMTLRKTPASILSRNDVD